ncbi:MAG: type II toxin-antitoxin system Phd/YefM family antitoxin [Acidithiobacillus sp.]
MSPSLRDVDRRNAVLLSQDLFDSLMETVYLLRSPANAAHLAQSIAQDQAGQTSPPRRDAGRGYFSEMDCESLRPIP